MQQHHLYLRIYYILAVFLTLQPQHVQSIRCKCNTNRGPAPCISDFCDIHSRDGKRAACGALRRARQTIFACVLIRRSTNDTYCHVVGSTTACWCRQMDFCNADLEAELFDVEEAAGDSEADSNEQSSKISGQEHEESITEATLQQLPAQHHDKTLSVTKPLAAATATVATATSSITVTSRISTSTKRSTKPKINPAIRMDFAEKMKVTPERKEQPPAVVAEMIYDNYEYELDENDDGYQWQAIAIPDSAVTSTAISIPPSHAKLSTNFQKVENSKTRTIEVVITKLSPTAPVTTTVNKTTRIERIPGKALNTTVTNITLIQDDSMKESVSGQSLVPNTHSVLLSNEKSPNSEVAVQDFRPKLRSNSLLSPVISLATSSMVFTSTDTDKTIKENVTTQYSAKAQEILLQQQQIPEKPSNYARRKLNSTSPTFVYTHSVPKTVLDQWKWEEEQQQQQQRSDLDRSDNIHDDSDSSAETSRLSSAFFTSSFSFLFLLLLFFSYHY